MTTDAKLNALAYDLMKFARGATRDDAAKLLAEIVAGWGMLPDQLPPVVDHVASGSGLSRAAVLMWLHMTTQIIRSAEGRQLCRALAPAADRIDSAEAAEPRH